MTDPIEAFAEALDPVLGYPVSYELAGKIAAALRETLVPVGWINPNWEDPAENDGLSPITVYPQAHWTPLYAMPEIKP